MLPLSNVTAQHNKVYGNVCFVSNVCFWFLIDHAFYYKTTGDLVLVEVKILFQSTGILRNGTLSLHCFLMLPHISKWKRRTLVKSLMSNENIYSQIIYIWLWIFLKDKRKTNLPSFSWYNCVNLGLSLAEDNITCHSRYMAQKMKFFIKDFVSICEKFEISCGFGHIYRRNP